MKTTSQAQDVNPAELVSIAARLLQVAASMSTPAPTAPSDEWLDERTMLAEYGMGRNAADARGIPRGRLGRKNRWRRSDIEAAIKLEPHKPRAKTIQAKAADGEDPFDALLASGAVVAMKGAR